MPGVGTATFGDVRRGERDGPAQRTSEHIHSGDRDLVLGGSHTCTDDVTRLDGLAVQQVLPAGRERPVADLEAELLGPLQRGPGGRDRGEELRGADPVAERVPVQLCGLVGAERRAPDARVTHGDRRRALDVATTPHIGTDREVAHIGLDRRTRCGGLDVSGRVRGVRVLQRPIDVERHLGAVERGHHTVPDPTLDRCRGHTPVAAVDVERCHDRGVAQVQPEAP